MLPEFTEETSSKPDKITNLILRSAWRINGFAQTNSGMRARIHSRPTGTRSFFFFLEKCKI